MALVSTWPACARPNWIATSPDTSCAVSAKPCWPGWKPFFWDYALAGRRIEIVEESLNVVRQQLAETEEMIQVGVLAESELAAVQAEVALQQQGLINARSELATIRLQLLRLLNLGTKGWQREITLVYQPSLPTVDLEPVEAHLRLARRWRPDLNQARLAIQRGQLDIVRTRNGLLPRMDLFVNLGHSGYADSFGGSVSDLGGGDYDAQAGIQFQVPLSNRDARAQYRRSVLQHEQAQKALQNLVQLVELDVLSAHIEIGRTREQIAASTATRKFQEEKLRIEKEKFRVGRSTNFLVTQAQRDLLAARISEVQSIVNYLKSLTNFYRLEGSLLERRGIVAPGAESLATDLEDAAPGLQLKPELEPTP